MSTEINVTVDSGGLLERSKLQVAANRQALVEGQQRVRAKQTGTEQRLERLDEENRDEQGSFLALPYQQSTIDRFYPKPAASRRFKKANIIYANASGGFTYVDACNESGCERYTFRPPIQQIGDEYDSSAGSIETPPNNYPFPNLPTFYRDYGQYEVYDLVGRPPTIPCAPPDSYLAYIGAPTWSEHIWNQGVNKVTSGPSVTVILPYSRNEYVAAHISYGISWFTLARTDIYKEDKYSLDFRKYILTACSEETGVYSYREEEIETTTFTTASDIAVYPVRMTCVLVGKNKQRQISAPTILMNKIAEYYTSLNYTETVPTLSEPEQVGRNYTALSYWPLDRVTTPFYISETSNVPVYGQWPGFTTVATPHDIVNISLHSYYKGGGALTPSIYALLRAIDVQEARSISTLEEYEAWYSQNPYRYAGINNVKPSTIEPDEGGEGVPVWNWNATAYCKSQLIALGFSDLELTL